MAFTTISPPNVAIISSSRFSPATNFFAHFRSSMSNFGFAVWFSSRALVLHLGSRPLQVFIFFSRVNGICRLPVDE